MKKSVTGLSPDNLPLAISWDEGVIIDVQEISHSELEDPQLYIAPGLIDNQVNGYKGVDFCSGDLSLDQVRQTVYEMWRMGITSFLPTLITMPEERLMHSLGILARAIKQEDIGRSLPGIHLEGPYISDQPGYRGAHNAEWTRHPDWEEFLRLQDAAEGNITQITLAPELPGALDFIKKCRVNNIVVAIGHHAASADQISQAVAAGAAVSTHLGNGCANLIDRHNNILWPQLANDDLMATIIADGFHLTPDELRVIYKMKSPQNLCLVSDMVAFGGLPAGEYAWNGNMLRVSEEGVVSYRDQKVLAGATVPLHMGLTNMMRSCGCTLSEAFRLATRNPARLNHLHDRGELLPGKRADFIEFRLHDNQINVQATVINGERAYTI